MVMQFNGKLLSPDIFAFEILLKCKVLKKQSETESARIVGKRPSVPSDDAIRVVCYNLCKGWSCLKKNVGRIVEKRLAS